MVTPEDPEPGIGRADIEGGREVSPDRKGEGPEIKDALGSAMACCDCPGTDEGREIAILERHGITPVKFNRGYPDSGAEGGSDKAASHQKIPQRAKGASVFRGLSGK